VRCAARRFLRRGDEHIAQMAAQKIIGANSSP